MDNNQFNEVCNDLSYHEELDRIYKEFPFWIRYYCSDIILGPQWGEIFKQSKGSSSECDQAKIYAEKMYHMLLQECDRKLPEINSVEKRGEVRRLNYQAIQERYCKAPLALVETLMMCLDKERLLWSKYIAGPAPPVPMDVETSNELEEICATSSVFEQLQVHHENLPLMIERFKGQTEAVEQNLTDSKKIHADYATDYPNIIQNEKSLTGAEFDKFNHNKEVLMENVRKSREKLLSSLLYAHQMVTDLWPLLDNKIVEWKEKQKMFFLELEITEPVEELKTLTEYCANVGFRIYTLYQVCEKCEKIELWKFSLDSEELQQEQLTQLRKLASFFLEKLRTLIQRSFIVTKQPCSTILAPSIPHFDVAVRVLALDKIPLDCSFMVTADLVLESKLQEDKPTETAKHPSFELHSNTCLMTQRSSTNPEVVAEFQSIQVREFKRPKRTRKKNVVGVENLFVCEQKFRLVFTGEFPSSLGNIGLRAVSLPMTIITNATQSSDCVAAQLWQCFSTSADNDFGPYEFPQTLPWSVVKAMLNKKMEVETGKALPEDQLQFLANKLAGIEDGQRTDYDKLTISWNKFALVKNGTPKYTFWKWFHGCTNLLRHNLNKDWRDDRIYGFISKKDAKELLKGCIPGVFMLRLSESTIQIPGKRHTGAIAPVVVAKIKVGNVFKKKVEHHSPYKLEDFKMYKNLGQVLANTDDANFQFLYPQNIPLKDAFKDYDVDCVLENQSEENKDHIYVGRTVKFKLLRTEVDDWDDDYDDDEDDDLSSVNPSSVQSLTSSIGSVPVSSPALTEPPTPESNPLPMQIPQYPRQDNLPSMPMLNDTQTPHGQDNSHENQPTITALRELCLEGNQANEMDDFPGAGISVITGHDVTMSESITPEFDGNFTLEEINEFVQRALNNDTDRLDLNGQNLIGVVPNPNIFGN